MQKISMQKKLAIFEDLCPNWNDEINDRDGFISLRNELFSRNGSKYSLQNCESCVVGEAYS